MSLLSPGAVCMRLGRRSGCTGVTMYNTGGVCTCVFHWTHPVHTCTHAFAQDLGRGEDLPRLLELLGLPQHRKWLALCARLP